MFDDQLLSRRLTWDEAQAFAQHEVRFVPDEASPASVPLEVVTVRRREGVPGLVQFSIVFRGPPDPVYPQSTYRFRHEVLGEYAFFVSPIARTSGGTDYEACFSHGV